MIGMDISMMCRLCYSRLRKPRDIFTTPGLLDRILKLTDIEINLDDDLPKHICDQCNVKLQFTEEFQRQIKEADKKIRAFVVSRRESLLKEVSARVKEPSESSKSCEVFEESKSFVYNDLTMLSLVKSYNTLINECRLRSSIKKPEDFMLPSSYASIPGDEITEENSVETISAGTLVNDRLSQPHNLIPGLWTTDPLNLLKVKSVRPLRNSDSAGRNSPNVSSSSTFRCRERRMRSTRSANQRIAKINSEIANNYVDSMSSSTSSASSLNSDFEGPNSILKSNRTLPNGISVGKNNVRKVSSLPAENKKLLPKCPICEKICANHRGVRIHIGWTHRAVDCKLCDASMPTRAKLREHMQLHLTSSKLSRPDVSIQCHICKNFFKSNAGLSIHIRSHTRTASMLPRSLPVKRKSRSIRSWKK